MKNSAATLGPCSFHAYRGRSCPLCAAEGIATLADKNAKRNKLVDKLHQLIECNGPLPHPVHKAYAFYRSKVHPDAHEDTQAYQRAHFSYREGYILTLRCIDNYFGSIIHEEDLENL